MDIAKVHQRETFDNARGSKAAWRTQNCHDQSRLQGETDKEEV